MAYTFGFYTISLFIPCCKSEACCYTLLALLRTQSVRSGLPACSRARLRVKKEMQRVSRSVRSGLLVGKDACSRARKKGMQHEHVSTISYNSATVFSAEFMIYNRVASFSCDLYH